MKGIKLLVFGFVFLLHFSIMGQSLDSIISLDNIDLKASKEKFIVGSKIEIIDSVKLNSVSGGSLTDMINRYLPIYIKQDAGGLSTIRFRGSSPDHTAILFDGININSLTLGHSNMSNIPMFLFDNITVQYGGSSSLNGTDAIGGSIKLNTNQKWNNGFSVGVQQNIASFGSSFTGLKFGYSNNRFTHSIRSYYYQKENIFPFLNIAVKDFVKDEFRKDKQKNASIKNYGILQEFNYKGADNFILSSKQWYQYNWHEIQPNMSENYNGADYKEIENKKLILTLGAKYFSGIHKVTTNLGYVYDYQLYNGNYSQIISTNRITNNTNYYNSNFLKGDLNIGYDFAHIVPDVYSYTEKNIENRLDIFALYKVNLFKKLAMAVNFRESIVFGYRNQFAPSLGLDYSFIKTKERILNSKFSISKSYKIPTFNDRFWGELGNPNLLSEDGVNYEIGTNYTLNNNYNSYVLGLSIFLMNIDQWIQWVPKGGIWVPLNIDRVQSAGIELSVKGKHQLENYTINWGANYSLTNVSEVNDFWDLDFSSGNQLIYTPKHLLNIYASVDYLGWSISAYGSYTGIRYTSFTQQGSSLKRNYLKGYFLGNISIGKKIISKKNTFSIHIDINNILDNAYQNQAHYAMPRRSFNLSLKYLYH